MAFTAVNEEDEYNAAHTAHDVEELQRRWFDVASRVGWKIAPFAKEGEAVIYALTSPGWTNEGEWDVYFCAGVHGDEPAAMWGLLEWAEENVEAMKSLSGLIVPCLNPRGIAANTRVDGTGRDMNRVFHDDRESVICEWKQLVGEARFRLALTLHEDYDAQGCYLYEIVGQKGFIGEQILAASAEFLPTDTRAEIDDSEASGGIIRGELDPEMFKEMGTPEAVYLHFHHADQTLTFETPSEHSLFRRVRAHVAAISGALQSAKLL
ncbi:MAG: M14 family metallocarboxypeptidase [Verrucomicrobiota bacterium]